MEPSGAASHRMVKRIVVQRPAFCRIVFISAAKEAAMALDIRDAYESARLPVPQEARQASDNLARGIHPAIYGAIASLALLFIVCAGTFAAHNDSYYVIAIACAFIVAAIGLPYQLWRVRQHGHDPRDLSLSHRTLRGWLNADLDVWQTRVKGRDAAAAILLPIVAVSIGLLCLAIVLHIDVG
jgi:hypothetical protein